MQRDHFGSKNPFYKHGATVGGRPTPEYKSYLKMRERCYRPSDISYPNYGGRGIKVCDRWLNSFENFLADMGRKPSLDHSLDRIDANGNYEPSNCRWATRKEQNNNTRCTNMITLNGKTQSLCLWSEEIGVVDYSVVKQRVLKLGWPADKALTVAKIPAGQKFFKRKP